MTALLRRVLAIAGLATLPAAAAAQARKDVVVVRVQVVDTLRAPVSGADVSIYEGLLDVRAAGVTDDAGRVTLTIKRDDGQRELITRKIGFARSSLFFHPSLDTLSYVVTMHRPLQRLEAVQVTEREDVKRKSYHLDADDIANAKRTILDGMDALTKLRPDILYGRVAGCGVENVWVNGKLMRGVLPNDMVQARQGIAPPRSMAPASIANGGSGRPGLVPKLLTGNAAVLTVMASIHPEHIEEMNYMDCFDTTVNKNFGSAALYVVLKDGIGFELNGRGSYVIDPKQLPFLPAERRARILGVYDDATGEPIADAEVVDVATGTYAKTTVTGTVTLGFLPDGQSTIQIRRTGYTELKLDVSISPRDTLPLTLLLTPKPK